MGSDSEKRKIVYESLAAQVKRLLRDNIIRGELKSGERLTETALSEQYGVSRASVREAIIELEKDGLLVKSANRSTEVIRPTKRDVREVFSLRYILELSALASWEGAGEEDLRDLAQYAERLNELPNEPSIERFQTDHDFHRRLVQQCGNLRLLEEWDRNSTLVFLFNFRATNYNPEALKLQNQHAELVDLLRRKDMEKARALWEQHLDNVVQTHSRFFMNSEMEEE